MKDNKNKMMAHDFSEVLTMITSAKERVWAEVNKSLIELYWQIGRFISAKCESDEWGMATVRMLAKHIQDQEANITGFSARNIWRMRKFYETYQRDTKVSALLTLITWTNHLHIMSKTKSPEERHYYLEMAAKTRYSERQLARLIDSATYERVMLSNAKLSAVLTQFPEEAAGVFKDSYVFEFLNLHDEHKETDLRTALVTHLKQFLLELGPDFSLIGQEYPVQVGMKDFRIDLLMHHRGLNCLVAFELKVNEFMSADLGQLEFYLEVLDQDIKKEHENPSVGILICSSKDEEVVKYAMNRSASPTMIADYETKLLNKDLLRRKLQELSNIIEAEIEADTVLSVDDE